MPNKYRTRIIEEVPGANEVIFDLDNIKSVQGKKVTWKTGQRLTIGKSKINKAGKRIDKTWVLPHTFCPFCGEKYKPAE
ncbi:hypothetical protein ACFFJX_09410 [Pseudarcicella hirudinis]|uniref:hypothetical protein n=1 Tax=Pseudarcicella hirudinis TaxID=1079859 RepID=UPI0035E878B4